MNNHRVMPRKITLQELRARLGITQDQLAGIAGVNRNTVSAIEYDPDHGIRLMTAWRIVKAVNRLRDSRELPAICIEHLEWKIVGVDHLPTLCNCDKPHGLRAIRACYGLSPIIVEKSGLCLSEWYRASTGQPVSPETAMAILEAVNGWLREHGHRLVFFDDLALNVVLPAARHKAALARVNLVTATSKG
jgi:DNA-binding XRE family transcriptional regulator